MEQNLFENITAPTTNNSTSSFTNTLLMLAILMVWNRGYNTPSYNWCNYYRYY